MMRVDLKFDFFNLKVPQSNGTFFLVDLCSTENELKEE